MNLKLYDTYKQKLVEFKPLKSKRAGVYTCGPTVYLPAHIGNMRYFIFQDILCRTLELLGFKVKHVMNITDVGHLSFDEDRIEKTAKKEHKSAWDIAKFYTDKFLQDIEAINVKKPNKLPKATEHIPEMIEIIKTLEDRGYTYETEQAIYFDTSKFKKYEQLAGQKLEEKRVAAREEVVPDKQKRQPVDFALWFKTVGRFATHEMRWDSPWGTGFPGWHIECSAMSRKYLGQPFDIHAGGIDLTTVHHPNEIAQSEAAFEVPLANYWIHSEFLLVEGQKMSKSLGNLLTLTDLAKQGFSPLDFRYLVLTSHYRNKLNFTWEGLGAAARAYANLRAEIEDYETASQPDETYLTKFKQALSNNLDTPTALAVLWELVRESKLSSQVKRATINLMDSVLGLNLKDLLPRPPSPEVQKLIKERDQARARGEWETADKLRHVIEEYGYIVEDRPGGTKVRKKHNF